MSEKQGPLGTITKVVFIGGAIILFVLLAIWIIRWVPKAISELSNVGGSITDSIRGGELIKVESNEEEVNSGDNFILSFDYSPTESGEYYISYSCEDFLNMAIQSASGPREIVCNTPFRIGENVERISLIPTLTKGDVFVDTDIRVSYKTIDNEDEVAFGTSIITVKNTDATSSEPNPFNANLSGSKVTSSPTTNNNYQPSQTTYTSQSGKADLVITNIARTEGQSALSFTVYNYGSKSTGSWFFSYTDAENPNQILTSPIQPSLNPGQGLFIQVRFDGQRYDNQSINIYVDSTNLVSESNESNNRSSVLIDGRKYGPYYYDPYYYYDYEYYYDENDEADLVIEDLEVGYMRGSRFEEDDSIDEDDTAAVRFTVRNTGGESTGRWRFEITNTPHDDDDDYNSGYQSSLRPGERDTIVVEFDDPDEGSYNIKVEIDHKDDVDEENERNNTETKRLRVNK